MYAEIILGGAVAGLLIASALEWASGATWAALLSALALSGASGCAPAARTYELTGASAQANGRGADTHVTTDLARGVRIKLPPIRVYAEDPALLGGADMWRRAMGETRDWIVESDPDLANVRLNVVEPDAGYCTDGYPWACVYEIGGLWSPDASQDAYFVRGRYDRVGDPLLGPAYIAAHEIGHLLGLTHRAGTIMQSGAPEHWLHMRWDCPDAESIDRLQRKLNVDGFASCTPPAGSL